MPNRVYVLLKPENTLARQIGWLKGRTAFEANRIMKHSGAFWAKDYFDHGFETAMSGNPVKAGLRKSPEDWERSSAHERRD